MEYGTQVVIAVPSSGATSMMPRSYDAHLSAMEDGETLKIPRYTM